MEGHSKVEITKLGEWTAFRGLSPATNTPPVDAVVSDSATKSDHTTEETPAPLSPITQKAQDDKLIADPPRLTGPQLLDLAQRFSTRDIVDLSNQATSGNLIHTTINNRLNAAMTKKAKATGKSKDEIRAELTEMRKANGIRATRREPHRRRVVTSNDVETEDDEADGEQTFRTLYADQDADDDHEGDEVDPDATEDDDELKAAKAAQAAADHEGDEVDPDETEDDDELKAAKAAQAAADHKAFNNQLTIKGEKMLLMAERYSNEEMSRRISEIPGNFPLKVGGVANRIHAALKRKAAANNVDLQTLRDELNDARKANGVIKPSNRPSSVRKTVKKLSVAPKTKTKLAAMVGNVKATSAPKVHRAPKAKPARGVKAARKAAPIIHREMVDKHDDESMGSSSDHGDHTFEELAAAQTLLDFFRSRSEAEGAAEALMMLHKEDAKLRKQSRQPSKVAEADGDSEMKDIGKEDLAVHHRPWEV